MTVEIPTGFAQCVLYFNETGVVNTMISTFGIDLGLVIEQPDVGTAAAVVSAWEDSLRAECFDTVKLTRVDVLGSVGIGSALPSAYGTKSGTAGPPWNSAVLGKLTSQRGRTNHGRMFHPGLLSAENAQLDGVLQSGRQADLNTAAINFSDALVAAEIPMVILHDSAGAGSGLDPAPVQLLYCTDIVGIVKRRRDSA